MTVINLTPHDIVIVGPGERTIPPSGVVARVSMQTSGIIDVVGRMSDRPPFCGIEYNCESCFSQFGGCDGIPVRKQTYGEVTGLPAPKEGTVYIVSTMVRLAVPDRDDVFSPGELVRGDDGQPIGCRGLVG